MNILVVVSHPDDEVLGFGASGYKFALKHLLKNIG